MLTHWPRMTHSTLAIRSHVLPAVRGAAVEVGAVAGLEDVAVAAVLQGYLALDHVEELHLPGLDDDLVRLRAARPRPERGHRRPDTYPGRAPPPDACQLLGGAVERTPAGWSAFRLSQEPPGRGRLEEARRWTRPGRRRALPSVAAATGSGAHRLDLRQHARGEAGLLGGPGAAAAPRSARKALMRWPSAGRRLRLVRARPASRRSARAT